MPWHALQDARHHCRTAGHPHAYWVRRVNADGSAHCGYRCPVCLLYITRDWYGTRGIWVTDAVARRYGATTFQVEDHRVWMDCARCHTLSLCQIHHWAPWAIHADAHTWPTAPLCDACHWEFHAALTLYIAQRVLDALSPAHGGPALRGPVPSQGVSLPPRIQGTGDPPRVP